MEKVVHQGCILSPCLFNLYAEYIMQNARLVESGLLGEISDDTTVTAESKKELKSLLMKVKEESEKSWLKTQHSENEDHGFRFHHFMANRCGNSGNKERLFWGAPKSLQMVTAAMKLKHTCSLEGKL